MSQTTIIISNLDKADFVASKNSPVSLASQIKNTLTSSAIYPDHPESKGVVSHWSELPFLNRIIAIFDAESDASCAYRYLQKAQEKAAENTAETSKISAETSENTAENSEKTAFRLPATARISQQENLLQRSKSSEILTQKQAPTPSKSPDPKAPKDSGDLAGYNEPEPKPIDMYADLLNAGIDISKFNTKDQVDEIRGAPGHQDSPGLGRTRSLTKTLFKPSLSIDTGAACSSGKPPLSPTITLDQS